jgi:hypothetical protein
MVDITKIDAFVQGPGASVGASSVSGNFRKILGKKIRELSELVDTLNVYVK